MDRIQWVDDKAGNIYVKFLKDAQKFLEKFGKC